MTAISSAGRPALLRALAARGVDVAIVGGGINGAGIARALALAGYAVALFEKDDYGWGTTWRSTKLIHGGLRYLEHGELGLVFESLRDRSRLLAEYPGMISPRRFLLPVYCGDRHLPLTIGAGLTLYDALSLRLHGPRLPWHRRLPARDVGAWEPLLRADGLRAAFIYIDCQAAYPERLCLQTLLEAEAATAATFNHATVEELLTDRGRVHGLRVRDILGGAVYDVPAHLVINAAGPWVDRVLTASAGVPRQVGGTKGVHIVVRVPGGGPRHAIYAEARTDHRPFFVVPWRGKHLVGTTDTRFEGDPDRVRAELDEVRYLLRETQALLPGAGIVEADVEYAYAGIRPLPPSPDGREGAITRRHLLRDHAADGLDGVLSVVGGKLSTYRSLSDQVVGHVRRRLGVRRPVSGSNAVAPARAGGDSSAGLAPDMIGYLRQFYGPRLPRLLALLEEQPELRRPLCSHGPDVEGQVVIAARGEQAQTLADVLLRRTGAGWNRCHGLDGAERAAALLAHELGWDAARTAHELQSYADEVERTFTRVTPANPAVRRG